MQAQRLRFRDFFPDEGSDRTRSPAEAFSRLFTLTRHYRATISTTSRLMHTLQEKGASLGLDPVLVAQARAWCASEKSMTRLQAVYRLGFQLNLSMRARRLLGTLPRYRQNQLWQMTFRPKLGDRKVPHAPRPLSYRRPNFYETLKTAPLTTPAPKPARRPDLSFQAAQAKLLLNKALLVAHFRALAHIATPLPKPSFAAPKPRLQQAPRPTQDPRAPTFRKAAQDQNTVARAPKPAPQNHHRPTPDVDMTNILPFKDFASAARARLAARHASRTPTCRNH